MSTPYEDAVRNLELAEQGLFGNASEEVKKKSLATIANITGENKTPVYTGTGSSFDKAIAKKVSERKSDGSKKQKATGIMYEYEDMYAQVKSSGMIPYIVGFFIFLLLVRR